MSEVVCCICGKIRPDPPSSMDSFDWRAWEHDGEGWYVFASWDRRDKRYLCRNCARIIGYDIDRRRYRI